jgi:hypothetical protein
MSMITMRGWWVSPYAVVGALALVLVVGATAVAGFRREDRRQVGRYQAWWIDGPACRPAASASALKLARRRSIIGEVTVARENGNVVCLEIKDHGGHGPGDVLACHLLTPGALAVTTPSGVRAFDPGAGRSAAVFATSKTVTCVTRINPVLFSAASQKPFE